MKIARPFVECLLVAVLFCAGDSALAAPETEEQQPDPDRISDQPKPLVTPDAIERPKPLIEIGDPFLESGPIGEAIQLPSGAVWQPSVQVFGTYRTAVQAFHDGDVTMSEWANRLDLFANLQLSGTERVLVGIRPLDDGVNFTGYRIDGNKGPEDEYNVDITTLFFEGDISEMFPNADPHDRRATDFGIAVGRQEMLIQEGLLINDFVDAVGIVRNNVLPESAANIRHTFVYGWNEIHRDDNIEENGVHLFGLFNQIDAPKNTIDVDLIYIHDPSDWNSGFYWGVSTVQRIGHINTSFRAVGSRATDGESAAVSDGTLLLAEVSWTPPESHDLVYVNVFWGIDEFASASRGPDRGGPLGRTGILFAAVELGRYGSALSNRADNAWGGAIGYQAYFDPWRRKQLILECGVRRPTMGDRDTAAAAGARYRQAIGQEWELQLDVFGSIEESHDNGFGSRIAIRREF